MNGNVWEWTNSWYTSSNSTRVLRGGGFYNNDGYIRVDSCLDSVVVLIVDYTGFVAFRM